MNYQVYIALEACVVHKHFSVGSRMHVRQNALVCIAFARRLKIKMNVGCKLIGIVVVLFSLSCMIRTGVY